MYKIKIRAKDSDMAGGYNEFIIETFDDKALLGVRDNGAFYDGTWYPPHTIEKATVLGDDNVKRLVVTL